MSVEVRVVDYGVGNLFSVCRALECCGFEPVLVETSRAILTAERLVLPGVGAFRDGMRELQARGLVQPIRDYCKSGRPLLGICLGMQMLLEHSEEFGVHEGLGVIRGRVVGIPNCARDGRPHKIPHIGWSALQPARDSGKGWEGTILKDIRPGESTYFVHSFNAMPDCEEHCLAYSCYGGLRITAAIHSGGIYGCQFHPEKSGPTGLRILKSFAELGNLASNPTEATVV